jgi:hypothetical protein
MKALFDICLKITEEKVDAIFILIIVLGRHKSKRALKRFQDSFFPTICNFMKCIEKSMFSYPLN